MRLIAFAVVIATAPEAVPETPEVAAPPAAPGGLLAQPGDRSISLAWDDPADAGIDSYEVRLRAPRDADWRNWKPVAGSTHATTGHTLPGLTAGVRYRIQVRAHSAAGAGPASEISGGPHPPAPSETPAPPSLEPPAAPAARRGVPGAPQDADGMVRSLLKEAGLGLQSGFTVYLDDAANRLIYIKEECGEADAAARFFLHVVPVNHNDLPAHPGTFRNLDFDFDRHGFRSRGRCVAIRDLPDYRIAYLATGQYTPRDGQLWKVTLTEPWARRDFAIHLRGNALVYLKEPCAAADAQARFFLHLRPAAAADLPAHRRAEGFDSLDFDFRDYGAAADGRCRAVVPLPAYEIAGIRTGQQAAAGEPLWAAEFTASRPPPAPPALTIAKWFDDHAAAISITYDGTSKAPNRIDKLVLDEGLVLDYEIVTQRYLDQVPDWVEHDLTELVPEVVPVTDAAIAHGLSLTAHGFGFFGHGHWHVDHDTLTYAQAYDSFRLCFEVMESLGLEPVAYAYPRGAGGEAETQQALADAGFLAGRLSFPALGQTPYIVPDGDTTPENWFFLPGLTMESIRFRECEWCINDTSELVPVLDQALARTAWIIPVYHNIGAGTGWGFYEWEDFEGDVRAIAARDFWVAPMNEVVLYLRERERAEASLQVIEQDGVTRRIAFTLADGLDNDRFDQPLTLLFRRPADWFGAPLEVTQNGRLVARIAAFAETAAISLPPNEEPYLVQPSETSATLRPPPAAPSGLTAPAGDRSISLDWNDPGDAGIASYEYRIRPAQDAAWPDWRPVAGSTYATTGYTLLRGLTNGVPYQIQLRARNAGGPGAPSDTLAMPHQPLPAAPRGLTTLTGDRSISLDWNDPGDAGIASYEYRIRPAQDAAWPDWRPIAGSTYATTGYTLLRGMANGVLYQIQVRARNAGGPGPASETSATPRPPAPSGAPPAPTGLTARPGDLSISLGWDDPGNPGIASYEFRLRALRDADWRSWRAIAGSTHTTTAHTLPGLTNGVLYQIQLRALNAAGPGEPSQTSATPNPSTSPPSEAGGVE